MAARTKAQKEEQKKRRAKGKNELPADEKHAEARFSAEREALMEALLNPDNRYMPVKMLCERTRVNGKPISRATYYRAMADKAWKEEYERKSLDLVKAAIAPSIHALLDKAARGDVQAIRMVLEMAGLYVEKRRLEGDAEKPVAMEHTLKGLEGLSTDDLRKIAEMCIPGKDDT